MIGWAVILVVAAAVCLLNVVGFTQHGRGRLGEQLIYEGSSWLSIALLAWLPWTILRATRNGPWWAQGLSHMAAALAFSAAHVGLFILFRLVLFAAVSQPYDPWATLGAFPFEAGKDVIAYGLCVGAYLFAGLLAAPRPAADDAPAALFDIRDGSRLVRVELADVLAISAAGNYVEFHLRDGRRPLMRSALSALEQELGPAGFVRTHRSWLVNAAAVTGLVPEGSGDFQIELGEGAAPLSRRYPDALSRLGGRGRR
ncbi:MAG: LytTR family DNA-binding domain-containing protein [Phenylobacterium sp.]|uniref:LytTR family DNA-binding domain-containing protein n=1 Tax=Phenylobacterium sp. TaxID=1871053 RepID=UPI00271AABFE|nr:LytTR family DNA-binding domain-containing protein [Phenylobacterium sp.]MDO8900777.1 LytTR family DNA-binding domain-containing protein [Phenylobacterium sp.]